MWWLFLLSCMGSWHSFPIWRFFQAFCCDCVGVTPALLDTSPQIYSTETAGPRCAWAHNLEEEPLETIRILPCNISSNTLVCCHPVIIVQCCTCNICPNLWKRPSLIRFHLSAMSYCTTIRCCSKFEDIFCQSSVLICWGTNNDTNLIVIGIVEKNESV